LLQAFNNSKQLSAHYISTFPLAWKQPYNRTILFFSSPAVCFRIAVLLIRRLTTLAFNIAYVGNTCFNCGKFGHCLSDCSLPRAPYAKLNELKKLLESDLKDNKYNKTEKTTL
jgi:hypothetical protein